MSGWSRGALIAAVAAIGVLGLLAEWVAYGPDGYASVHPGSAYPWILDLTVGYIFLACGSLAALRRPDSLVGLLFLMTSMAWFSATLVEPSRFVGTAMEPSLVFGYRAFLAQAIVTFPSGRPSGLFEWSVVLAAYVTSLIAPLWYGGPVGVVLILLLAVATWRSYRRARGWERPARREALRVASLMAATVMVLTLGWSVGLPYPLSDAMSIVFHLVMILIPARLTYALLRSTRLSVSDLELDLDEAGPPTLTGELSRLLGDPTITIEGLTPLAATSGERHGRPAGPMTEDADRTMIEIDRSGQAIGIVTCQRGTLDDPGIRAAVLDAARLSLANAHLREQVQARIGELGASRRRLVIAGDQEGERLAIRLRDGALRRLDTVRERLTAAMAATTSSSDGATTIALERAQERLARVEEDVRDFAMGLGPRPLSEAGLEPAIAELAEECPFPVTLRFEGDDVSPELATEAYLVCSEALANVVKHAGASSASVDVAVSASALRLTVSDDGVGGAALVSGSGLRGLADRVAALEGSLTLRSEPGHGTRLHATLPRAAMPANPGRRTVESRTAVPPISLVSTDVTPAGHS